jgi:hypothetical protein
MINRSPVVTAPEKYRTRGIFYSFFALRRLAERTRFFLGIMMEMKLMMTGK